MNRRGWEKLYAAVVWQAVIDYAVKPRKCTKENSKIQTRQRRETARMFLESEIIHRTTAQKALADPRYVVRELARLSKQTEARRRKLRNTPVTLRVQ